MKFALNKKFDSATTKVFGTKNYFEVTKTAEDNYLIIEHNGDIVSERGDFNKEELKALWIILTANE